MKKIFVTDYIGLCNRLEALTLSFAIREYYGHEIFLDWPELDAIRIIGAKASPIRVWDRVGSIKIRNCSESVFCSIGNYRSIIQRTGDGPSLILGRLFLPVARRIRINPILRQTIIDEFQKRQGNLIVGVHIRRGDFHLANQETYDITKTRHPAVPTWWYEYAMKKLVERYRNVSFFISCSGDAQDIALLNKNFDTFELPTYSPYSYKGEDHRSTRHPVADLFALACCHMLIGTPFSTFSHYAANALGGPCHCILPPALVTPDNPLIGIANIYGERAPAWDRITRENYKFNLVKEAGDLPEIQNSCYLDWL